jgi:tRNA-2-methylthio-N6-dimethylallyladenosine synthase
MKFHIHTYGCQMNVRESEAVEALLLAAGHERVAGEEDAELVIVNSCTVRQKAEEKALGKAGNLLAAGKITGVMGCAVKRLGADIFRRLGSLHFAVGPRRFSEIPSIVEKIISVPASVRPRRIADFGDNEVPSGLGAHPVRKPTGTFADVQSFVTVMIGCDNRCSYCIVPDVRGHEWCRPAEEIIVEVKCLASRGVKEVCLLGQSVLSYKDGSFAFPDLLREVQKIDGISRIRFTSAHPSGCTDALIAAYRDCDKVCRHLHLPVQSGSDRVLAQMGRRYTAEEYLSAVAKMRALDPEFSVTTDVIVGYPGESEEDFEMTRALMEKALFDNAFIFKYSPRPGTKSAQLPDDVPTEEKERRNQILLADQERRGVERNSRLVGTVRSVLVEGPSKRNAQRWSGRDSGNRIVAFEPPAGISVGDMLEVRITEAHAQVLIGEVV